jgi:hypothetical protein
MADQGPYGDPPEFTVEDDIDEVLGRGNPNPARVGCPPRAVLMELARRKRPIGDPAYEHLTTCSPCYREFRAWQQAHASQPRGNAFIWMAAAAVLIAFFGVWFFFVARAGAPPDHIARQQSPTAVVPAELDLRQYAVARNDQRQSDRPASSLSRGRLNMTILLPVGWEPGAYEVQVLDSELRSRAAGSGRAEIRDFVTTLQTTLDLSSLPPGAYQLAIRRNGEDWHLFPADVQ